MIEDMLERRKATLSGLLSDLLTASLAKRSRVLVENRWPNGHPDLVVKGRYPNDAVKAGVNEIEIKNETKNKSAASICRARSMVMRLRISNRQHYRAGERPATAGIYRRLPSAKW